MRILSLDVGTKRIGVAYADTSVRIAIPRTMIPVDGNELAEIEKQFRLEKADFIVSGLPRNNQGEETKQTEVVREFIDTLKKDYFEKNSKELIVKFQDETLTSVEAEKFLTAKTHEFSRKDRATGVLDSEAAAIILQDFMEAMNINELEGEINRG